MKKDNWPKENEVDKLVEDFCEPAENNNFKVEAKFKAIDNFSPAIFKMNKSMLEKELDRELTDYETEQILAFNCHERKNSEAMRKQFMNTKLGIPWTLDEMPKKKYSASRVALNDAQKWNPSAKRNELIDRDVYLKGVQCGLSESTIESLKHYHNFKKRKFSFKNLIMKVVEWWRG